MEDSKLYSTQDIEKLKEKIDTYRETLTTLKMGTSIEDYLFMKNEFEELKKQIAHLEGLTETIDGKQSTQIKEYEGQVKQLSIQIEALNQSIEEMNHEILAILNKLTTFESQESTDQISTNIDVEESSVKHVANPPRKFLEEIVQNTAQSPLPTTEPTYKFLQNLAGKASSMHNGTPFTPTDQPAKKQEERHFNQQYFQSINTHPSQIYNGLYRNNTAEPTFHFKNAVDMQGIPVSVLETNSLTAPHITETTLSQPPSPIAEELEKLESSSSLVTNLDNIESSTIAHITESTLSESSLIAEVHENIELVIEESSMQITALEEFSSQTEDITTNEGIEEEPKKEKNSLFFNLFRRRN
ncbi:hypothetical protein ACIQXI_18980 [Lysinibacillus sp. NPDC097195]|uniref:hypothetical protein n=1 Tax=Lysinibacillus sp. NPDC097195 TaxID=3364141 RepID=UPI00381E8401